MRKYMAAPAYSPGQSSGSAYASGYQDGYENGKQEASRPDTSFMDKVKAACDRRRIFWMRMLFFWGGVSLFLFGPVIMHELYRLWYWAGSGDTCASIGAGIVGGVIMVAGVFFSVSAFIEDAYSTW